MIQRFARLKRSRVRRSDKAQSRHDMTVELDGLVRSLVLARDKHACVKCGAGGPNVVLQASHILSKGPASRIRFDTHNVLTMCLRCHIYWWHKEPTAAYEWLEQKYPGRLAELRIMAATAPRVDMPMLLLCLRQEVLRLESSSPSPTTHP